MRVVKVAGGGYEANQYLAVHDGEAVLVEAGTGLNLPGTLEGVDDAIGDAELVAIYLTHWHADHVGGAAAVHEALGAELVMPEAEAHAVRDGRADLTLADNFGLPQRPAPVRGVEPGDTIEVGGEAFQVLHTPGHTAGHTSLWHEPTRSLVAGDSVFSDGAFGRVDLPTGDPADMLATLERLAGMDVANLYPGHMRVVEGDAHKHVELARSQARGLIASDARSAAPGRR